MCATLPKSKKKAEEVSVGVGGNGSGKDCTRQSDGQEEREYGKDMSWGGLSFVPQPTRVGYKCL